jgi:hypothetical protein
MTDIETLRDAFKAAREALDKAPRSYAAQRAFAAARAALLERLRAGEIKGRGNR